MTQENEIRNSYIDFRKHAYILNVDENFEESQIINEIKIAVSNHFNKQMSEKINTLIDSGNYSDLKIVKPIGKSIKKEQLLELMNEFKESSYYNWKKIYIVEYAEDLTQSSANTILKFLEEPESDIVAILITKNFRKLLPTIISRCEIVSIGRYAIKKYEEIAIEKTFEYVKKIEENKTASISFLNDLYLLKNEDLKNYLELMILIYEDIICYIKLKKIKNFNRFLNEVVLISKKCEIEDLFKKIKCLEKMIKLIEYNVNNRIILDSFFIGGYYE